MRTCKSPLSWMEVRNIIESGRLEVLGRSPAEQEVYQTFIHETKEQWCSIADFILSSKFGIPDVVEKLTGKRCADRNRIDPSDIRLIFARNEFPYDFEEGIHHFVLWKLGGPLTTEEVLKAVQSTRSIFELPDGSLDYCYYFNPPHLQSIPDINHAHILYHNTNIKTGSNNQSCGD